MRLSTGKFYAAWPAQRTTAGIAIPNPTSLIGRRLGTRKCFDILDSLKLREPRFRNYRHADYANMPANRANLFELGKSRCEALTPTAAKAKNIDAETQIGQQSQSFNSRPWLYGSQLQLR
jgi:hypothetical protein